MAKCKALTGSALKGLIIAVWHKAMKAQTLDSCWRCSACYGIWHQEYTYHVTNQTLYRSLRCSALQPRKCTHTHIDTHCVSQEFTTKTGLKHQIITKFEDHLVTITAHFPPEPAAMVTLTFDLCTQNYTLNDRLLSLTSYTKFKDETFEYHQEKNTSKLIQLNFHSFNRDLASLSTNI